LFSVLQIVEEAMARGVKFLPIDLYKSDAVNFLLLDNQLLCPFTSIDGLGENAARKIVEEREKGEFISIEDCKKRTGLSKTVIETLKSHNCFGDIPDSDQLELF
jgi:DNA polymerase-3 subunit alpha (Gram-positive type)